MNIAALTLEFHLPHTHSLKEKRACLRPLRDKFGKVSNIAVSETEYHDKHQRAQWQCVVVGADKAFVEQLLASIQDYAQSGIDGMVTQNTVEWL